MDNINNKTLSLEELINTNTHSLGEALLWLTRALELMESLFTNLINDRNCEESMTTHAANAYRSTLSKHHNYFVKKTCAMMFHLVPNRTQLFSEGETFTTNMKHLESHMYRFSEVINYTNSILNKNSIS